MKISPFQTCKVSENFFVNVASSSSSHMPKPVSIAQRFAPDWGSWRWRQKHSLSISAKNKSCFLVIKNIPDKDRSIAYQQIKGTRVVVLVIKESSVGEGPANQPFQHRSESNSLHFLQRTSFQYPLTLLDMVADHPLLMMLWMRYQEDLLSTAWHNLKKNLFLHCGLYWTCIMSLRKCSLCLSCSHYVFRVYFKSIQFFVS